MKKIFCVILILITLTFVFISCNKNVNNAQHVNDVNAQNPNYSDATSNSGASNNFGTSSKPSNSENSGKPSNLDNLNNSETSDDSSHKHTFNNQVMDAKYLANEANCTLPLRYYYSCDCGAKGKQTFSQGHPTYHSTVNGECNKCGVKYFSPYYTAVNKANETYNNTLSNIAEYIKSEKATLTYLEKSLKEEMKSNGIYSVLSASYYEDKIDDLKSQINQKYSDITYYSAISSGNYTSKINSLKSEISSLQSQLSEVYEKYSYAQQFEQISEDRKRLDEENTALKQEAYETLTKELKDIKDDYPEWETLYEAGHINFKNVWVEEVAPTCTEDGSEILKCDYCDFSVSRTIAKLGHNLLEPDCTNEYKCSRCTYSEGSSLGHDWAAATCTTDKMCRRCFVTGDVAALGHEHISHEAKAPTCTESGYKAFDTCSRCDYTTYEFVSSLGHNMLVSNKKDATVTEDGFCDTYCSRCSHTEREIYYATGTLGLSYSLGKDPYTKQEGYNVSIGTAQDKVISIPAIYNGYPVVTVNINGCKTVETLLIPSSVNTINANNCTALKFVQFASESNLTYLTFNECSNLQEFIMPKSNLAIINFSFQNCSNLKKLEISESVDTITSYSYPLRGCNSIETLILPDLTYDESIDYALKDLYGVSMGEVPQALKHVIFSKIVGIDSMDFYNCSYIQSVSLPKTMKYISSGFYGCTSLKTINYEGTVEEWKALVNNGKITLNITNYKVVCSNGTIQS